MVHIKAIGAICGLYSINKLKNQTIITSNKCFTDPKYPFNKNYYNRKGPFNLMSSARSLNEKGWLRKILNIVPLYGNFNGFIQE